LGASGCGKTTLLSCILGIYELNEGTIDVLGQRVGDKEHSSIGLKIGYMPQEVALLNYLTVKETVYFFGNIAQMDSDDLSERYKLLKKLFEIRKDDQLVHECSGGERRRVSLISTLIHDPELLILDEPTVGLDPILRHKIWEFMIESTRKTKLSIIITTHYFEEAKQADCCGFMRNGVLLAEDSPLEIMKTQKCERLDEAFLKLSIEQEESYKNNLRRLSYVSDIYRPLSDIDIKKNDKKPDVSKRKCFNRKTMKSLLWRNYIQATRQIG
jgi:ABC-type multidrug transport system ATPase subunit